MPEPLSTTANLIAGVTTWPRLPENLWYPYCLPRPDWAPGIRFTSQWRTQIQRSSGIVETRRGLLQRPLHSISFTWTCWDQAAARARTWLWRRGVSAYLVPVFHRATPLQAAAAVGSRTIQVSPGRCDRFPIGGWVLLAWDGMDGEWRKFVLRKITGVDLLTGELSLLSPIEGEAVPAGARVMPGMECKLSTAEQHTLLTDRVLSLQVNCLEREGPSQLPPLWTVPGDTPKANLPTYLSLPVMTVRPDWSLLERGVQAQGAYAQSGVGSWWQPISGRGVSSTTIPTVNRPYHVFEVSFTDVDNCGEFLLDFFDSRAGMLHPFWFPDPQSDFSVQAIGATYIDVLPIEENVDWQHGLRKYVYLRLVNGWSCHVVTGITRTEGVDRLALHPNPPLGVDVSQLVSAGALLLVRFDTDEASIQAVTPNVATVSFRIIELPGEVAEIELANAADYAGTPGSTPWTITGQCHPDNVQECSQVLPPYDRLDWDMPANQFLEIALRRCSDHTLTSLQVSGSYHPRAGAVRHSGACYYLAHDMPSVPVTYINGDEYYTDCESCEEEI